MGIINEILDKVIGQYGNKYKPHLDRGLLEFDEMTLEDALTVRNTLEGDRTKFMGTIAVPDPKHNNYYEVIMWPGFAKYHENPEIITVTGKSIGDFTRYIHDDKKREIDYIWTNLTNKVNKALSEGFGHTKDDIKSLVLPQSTKVYYLLRERTEKN